MLKLNNFYTQANKLIPVKLTFECAPEEVEMLLALAAPFLQPQIDGQIPAALPNALIKLARWLGLDVKNAPHPIWSQATIAAVFDFVERMAIFEDELSFNYSEWADLFMDHLYALKESDESKFEDVFLAIRIVVNQVKSGQYHDYQRYVYFSRGIPLDFDEWAERILNGSVTEEQIYRAHYKLFAPERLRRLLQGE